MLGGLTMCELSVNDGEQQSEQNEGDRNQCDDWNILFRTMRRVVTTFLKIGFRTR